MDTAIVKVLTRSIALCMLLHLPAHVAGNHQTGREPLAAIPPCDLVFHGRDFRYVHPDLPDKPLSHGDNLPVEFYLHAGIPRQYRPVMHAAAAELNMRVGFRMIAIRSAIDRGDMNQRRNDSRNVIYWDDYWANSGGIEWSEVIRVMEAASTHIQPVVGPEPWLTISDVDIVVYGEKPNTAAGIARVMFSAALYRLGVERSLVLDADLVDLQDMLIERLSSLDGEAFHDMVVQTMVAKGIEVPDAGAADVQDWIIGAVNAERGAGARLASFEDLRELWIDGFSMDLERLNTAVVLKNHMLHEFGHALGLAHNEVVDSLMNPGYRVTAVPSFPADLLVEHDFDDPAVHGLGCTYDLDRSRRRNPL